MANIDQILDRALKGQRINFAEGVELWQSNDVEKLGRAANFIVNKRYPEKITTFVVGRNVNYTNICDTYCRFCAFYRAPGSDEGYVLPDEEILRKIDETIAIGGTEILMQGGTNPNLPLSYYTDLLQKIKSKFPEIHMHSFSPIEIIKMQEISGLTLEQVILELKEAGLDSIPGGGAEILVDRVRNKISRIKRSWRDWMNVMQTTHRLGMHTTATMVIGFGETLEERVQHLMRIREAQDETEGFLAFIVWTYQPIDKLPRERLGADDYLKAVAISRIFLDNIPHLQSSWVTMGPEVGKLSLSYGCDDFGSTMMEENVVSAAGTTHKVNVVKCLQLIREAGKTPAQRNTKYEIINVFKEDKKSISIC